MNYLHDIGGENDLGYALSKQYWRQGYASEACRAVVAQLRGRLALYYGDARRQQSAQWRSYEKIGMKYECSYDEFWQPKNIWVIFKKYRRILNGI